MKKINFVNGETIDGANTFNTMQDNVENVFNGKESMGSIVVEDVTCKNKFNKNTITSGKGINTATGNLYSQNNLFTTDYIDVTNESDIAWNGTYTSGTKPWGAFYDSNKKYISGFETTLNVNTIAIPTGVAYVRLTYADNSNDFLNNLQIESGKVATNYVEHKEISNKQIYSTNEQVIGTWTDGKPLYRKTISIHTPPTTNNTEVYNFDKNFIIKNYYGFVTISASSQLIPINFYFTNEYNVATYITKNTGKINMKVGSVSYTNQLVTISLEYTKTTD